VFTAVLTAPLYDETPFGSRFDPPLYNETTFGDCFDPPLYDETPFRDRFDISPYGETVCNAEIYALHGRNARFYTLERSF